MPKQKFGVDIDSTVVNTLTIARTLLLGLGAYIAISNHNTAQSRYKTVRYYKKEDETRVGTVWPWGSKSYK